MDPYRMTDNNNSVSKCYIIFSGLLDYACSINTSFIYKYLLSSVIYIHCTAVPPLLCIDNQFRFVIKDVVLLLMKTIQIYCMTYS